MKPPVTRPCPRWSTEHLQFLRDNYATMPNAEIGKACGRTTQAVGVKAMYEGLKKPPEFRLAAAADALRERARKLREVSAYGDLRAAIFTMVETAPSTGISSAQVVQKTGADKERISSLLRKMTISGLLHRAQVQGVPARWFSTAKAASKWTALEVERLAVELAEAKRRASRRAPMPMARPGEQHARQTAAARREMPMVIPPWVKVQRAPAIAFDPRYQLAPGADVPRVFSLVPVGVDPMTGRGWGVRA